MIRLSKLTDYAVVLLTAMADDVPPPPAVHTAASLAERTGLPAPTVAKVLKLLAQAQLVISHRGASGGYGLSRSPLAISVADIIQAIDGPIAITDCVEGSDAACGVGHLCAQRGNWDKVNRAVHQALAQVSLADMAPQPIDFMLGTPSLTAPSLPTALPEAAHGRD